MTINLLKGEISEAAKILWMVLSFFALKPEQQIVKIGPAGDWFCKEDENKNPGANYLIGMGIVYEEYWIFGFDEAKNEHEEMIFKSIYEQLEKMFAEDRCWSENALSENDDWQHLRMLAHKALDALGLHLHPLRKPICFPDVIHIDHYDYKRDPWKIS
ncbi:hypothetical protein DENIS_3418 [Desulfonema ishimotonii]|uniref:Uncharacterized protein n=1 Tax=Desulfonema ishimotonii TaxID=45657 RepID=A0A401FZT1_9BACT|nr:hypothetical protein [Desulfonema ishimotonii]GBC62446.1 hypothetical protein DENIS_3418 [Desulfonema ishimotonii]